MARPLRIQYPGAMYPVMNRGDQREDIFHDDEDRQRFLGTLTEACGKTEWQIHAYCLLRNHFHWVIETPQPNLVFGMKWLLGTYTKRFHIRHKICGHLFAGRYKALVVDGSGNGYLRTVCDDVHLNPVRARLLPAEVPLEQYRWSSYPDYRRQPEARPRWLRVDRLLGEKGIPKDSEAGREQFSKMMEARRAEESTADYEQLRKDWVLGTEQFRKELLAAVTERIGPSHFGEQRQETAEQKAERLLTAELEKLGWKEESLRMVSKRHPVKVQLARRLRAESTMSLKWIAARLQMGSWTYVSNLLHAKPNPERLNQDLLPLCQ